MRPAVSKVAPLPSYLCRKTLMPRPHLAITLAAAMPCLHSTPLSAICLCCLSSFDPSSLQSISKDPSSFKLSLTTVHSPSGDRMTFLHAIFAVAENLAPSSFSSSSSSSFPSTQVTQPSIIQRELRSTSDKPRLRARRERTRTRPQCSCRGFGLTRGRADFIYIEQYSHKINITRTSFPRI